MSRSLFASQIKLIDPPPAITASDRGAAGANVSTGVMQVRGDAGPITVASATLSTGRASKQRSDAEHDIGDHMLGDGDRRRGQGRGQHNRVGIFR